MNISSAFDGWGYTHLYKNEGDKLTAVDHYAIPEASDEAFSTGFGDLTVHEFATDPSVNIAYSSYYGGGMRVMSFGDAGLDEVGKFIETDNDFWGVEQFTTPAGQRLIAGSDRELRPVPAQVHGPWRAGGGAAGLLGRDGDDGGRHPGGCAAELQRRERERA